jgi:hypothetical protein
MKRRQFLGAAAAGVASPGSSRTTESEGSAIQSASDARIAQIRLPAGPLAQVQVLADRWISHEFGYVTAGDEGRSELVRVREAAEHEFVVDGRRVARPDRYWSEISTANGHCRIGWRFVTPPRPPGIHGFEATVEFSEPMRTERRDGTTHVWEGSYDMFTRYRVMKTEADTGRAR